jgi:hypothetical protein
MSYQYANYGVDTNCDGVGDFVYDFSQGTLRDLDEDHLNERTGLCCDSALDWDNDGRMITDLQLDISLDSTTSVLDDHDDWGHVRFDFRTSRTWYP